MKTRIFLLSWCALLSFAGCGDNPKVECGDGLVETGETCDDGNTADGDGCSATCQLELPDDCEVGSFLSPDGATCIPLTDCTNSEYESTAPTTTSDRACTALTTCTGTEYESTAPTATSDRVCSALTT